MSGDKTLAESMAEVNRAFREAQRAIEAQVMPPLERLTVQLNTLMLALYRQRLKRWLPFAAVAFVAGLLIAWWLA